MQTNALILKMEKEGRDSTTLRLCTPLPPPHPTPRLVPVCPHLQGQAWLCSQAPLGLASHAPPLGPKGLSRAPDLQVTTKTVRQMAVECPRKGPFLSLRRVGRAGRDQLQGLPGRRGPRSLR